MRPVTIRSAAVAVFLRTRATSLPGVMALLGMDAAKIGEDLDEACIGKIARSMGWTPEKLLQQVAAHPPSKALMGPSEPVASVSPVNVPAPAPASTPPIAPEPLPVTPVSMETSFGQVDSGDATGSSDNDSSAATLQAEDIVIVVENDAEPVVEMPAVEMPATEPTATEPADAAKAEASKRAKAKAAKATKK